MIFNVKGLSMLLLVTLPCTPSKGELKKQGWFLLRKILTLSPAPPERVRRWKKRPTSYLVEIN